MAAVSVDGATELVRDLGRARDRLGDLSTVHLTAARAVLAQTRPPRRTGALAATLRAEGSAAGAVVMAGGGRVHYAGPQQWGVPRRNIPATYYLTDALERSATALDEIYAAGVQTILDGT